MAHVLLFHRISYPQCAYLGLICGTSDRALQAAVYNAGDQFKKNEVTQAYSLILDILIGIRGLRVKTLSGTLVLRLYRRARLSKR